MPFFFKQMTKKIAYQMAAVVTGCATEFGRLLDGYEFSGMPDEREKD